MSIRRSSQLKITANNKRRKVRNKGKIEKLNTDEFDINVHDVKKILLDKILKSFSLRQNANDNFKLNKLHKSTTISNISFKSNKKSTRKGSKSKTKTSNGK